MVRCHPFLLLSPYGNKLINNILLLRTRSVDHSDSGARLFWATDSAIPDWEADSKLLWLPCRMLPPDLEAIG